MFERFEDQFMTLAVDWNSTFLHGRLTLVLAGGLNKWNNP